MEVFNYVVKALKKIQIIGQLVAMPRFNYVGDILKKDDDFLLSAININPQVFAYVPSLQQQSGRFREGLFSLLQNKDPAFLLEAIRGNAEVFSYIDGFYKSAEAFLLKAIKGNAEVFNYVGESFKRDPNFILDAISRNAEVFNYVGDSFKRDEAFILEAIESNADVFKYATESEADWGFPIEPIYTNVEPKVMSVFGDELLDLLPIIYITNRKHIIMQKINSTRKLPSKW